MNIHHEPLFNTEIVEEHYTKKDSVPVKYVCSTALNDGINAMDVYYRETPHPEFGNRYFGLFSALEEVCITNADSIEQLEFAMIENEGKYYYSRHRHDYVAAGERVIDGGRAYIRGRGPFTIMRVKDGQFITI